MICDVYLGAIFVKSNLLWYTQCTRSSLGGYSNPQERESIFLHSNNDNIHLFSCFIRCYPLSEYIFNPFVSASTRIDDGLSQFISSSTPRVVIY